MDAQILDAVRANCSAFNFVTIPDEPLGRLAHVMSQVYILYVFLRLFGRAKLHHGILTSKQLRPHIAAVPSSRARMLSKLFQPPANLPFVTKEFVEEACGQKQWEEAFMPTWSQKVPDLFRKDVYLNTWPMASMHLHNNTHIYKDLFRLLPEVAEKSRLALLDITKKLASALATDVPDDTIFVHVRRTDYNSVIQSRHAMETFTGQDVDNLILKFMDTHPKANYIIFSDDENWCREHLTSMKNFENVLMAPVMDGDAAFGAMARCDHGIATVGSFGLWAGILTGGHLMRLVQKTDKNRDLVQNIDESLENHELVYFPAHKR